MLPAPCYVFSDAHLGFASRDAEQSLLAFLRHVRSNAASLLINGDLFEFWFEWRSVIPRPAFRVLASLAEIRDAGIPVLMLAGNHDCWGGDVLREDVGMEYVMGPWEGELGGWRAHVEHGDGLRGREDRKYRALRRVLRNPLAVRAFRSLHPDWGSALATRSSHASRSYVARDEGRGLRLVAEAQLASRPDLEMVLFGHSHVPALERVSHRQVYANAGSWIDSPTFLRLTPERAELRSWDGSPEGANLNSVDRASEESLS